MPVNRIPVLMYHHVNPHAGDTVTVTPEVFAGQMNFLLTEGYETLSIDELMEFITGKRAFSPKAVAITFDDGWLDNFVYAAPILKKCNFKASFFVITGRIDAAAAGINLAQTKIPVHETAKELILSNQAEQVVINWDIIRKSEDSGLCRFYSHTVNHKRCADLSVTEVVFELSRSKERLESELGRACDYLCWPYGSFSCHNVQAAAEIGYKGIFTTIDGCCESGSDPFMIKRIEVTDSVLWLKNRLFEGNL